MTGSKLTRKKQPVRNQSGKNPDTGRTPASGHLRNASPVLAGLTNHCFGCSTANRHGLHLKFTENTADRSVECRFRVARRFEGPPGHVHGGIIATILDEAMGKVNRQKGVVALTRHMAIDYLRPVPLGVPLRAVGWVETEKGRKHFHIGEIRTPDGTVLARSHGVFVAIDPAAMFERHLQKSKSVQS